MESAWRLQQGNQIILAKV